MSKAHMPKGRDALLSSADDVVRITEQGVAFPVLDEDGSFGQIVVDHLVPGQAELVLVNGRRVLVIREYVH